MFTELKNLVCWKLFIFRSHYRQLMCILYTNYVSGNKTFIDPNISNYKHWFWNNIYYSTRNICKVFAHSS